VPTRYYHRPSCHPAAMYRLKTASHEHDVERVSLGRKSAFTVIQCCVDAVGRYSLPAGVLRRLEIEDSSIPLSHPQDPAEHQSDGKTASGSMDDHASFTCLSNPRGSMVSIRVSRDHRTHAHSAWAVAAEVRRVKGNEQRDS
jgi:hypothetical protein